MIYFFQVRDRKIIALEVQAPLNNQILEKLEWLFDEATCRKDNRVEGIFVGPRKEMITPWSTNAVEISENMGITGIRRIVYHATLRAERFTSANRLPSISTITTHYLRFRRLAHRSPREMSNRLRALSRVPTHNHPC